MNHSYLNNVEFHEALEIYMNKIKDYQVLRIAEVVPVKDSLGYVTAQAVVAKISSPHYNASAMDGIALLAKSTFGATETTPVVLREDSDFIRVDTGDPLPNRFDAVVMIEDVIDMGDGQVKLIGAAAPWQHVRQIGEDICKGEMILPSNTGIEPWSIGAMLAGGVLNVKVWKRPMVGIIPTGDEIVAPTDSPKEGEILEFNSSIFASMLKTWGAETRVYAIVRDRKELVRESIVNASKECDVVLVNAGSSAGREDYTKTAIEESGEVFLHGIAIRPGKPTILGVVNHKPVIGVPGYPVSGIIVMDKLVKPVIEYLLGKDPVPPEQVDAVLARKIMSTLKYKEFVRVKLGQVGGRLVAVPLNRGAGVVTSFVRADGIMEIPMNIEGYEAGTKVSVQLLKSKEEVRNALVVTGSHDPLIDGIADLVRKTGEMEFVSSSHVGSMGGLMAIKRGEAHVAGIHLLDEATGRYNIEFIKKYLGEERIVLIQCVKRIQGLMVKGTNPKSIKSIQDIADPAIKYVNRQKGSGTRILLDYLLKKNGILPSAINGYEREEFTHMSVAALVASESADAGLGIYSAAKAYDLEFIPVCEEQYDFIAKADDINTGRIQKLISILKSAEFGRVLCEMGGYILEKPGEVTPV